MGKEVQSPFCTRTKKRSWSWLFHCEKRGCLCFSHWSFYLAYLGGPWKWEPRRRCLTILAYTARIPLPGTVRPHLDTAKQNDLPSCFEARRPDHVNDVRFSPCIELFWILQRATGKGRDFPLASFCSTPAWGSL